jgi:phosphoserine phosphatase RsbU/P
MRHFKIRLSLRYKLLGLLVTLPLASLGLYLLMATDLFKKDKVAYVFDSSATVSRSLATQTRMEVQNSYSTLRSVVESFDFTLGEFNSVAKDSFTKNSRLHSVILFRKDNAGQFAKLGQLVKDSSPAQSFSQNENVHKQLRDHAEANAAYMGEEPSLPGSVRMAFRLGEKEDPNQMIVVGLSQADDFLGAFEGAGLYASFVVTRGGAVAVGALEVVGTDLNLLGEILKTKASEGTAEAKFSDGLTYLVSFASVGIGDLIVISKVDKNKALKAVEVLVAKSLLFFVALLSITLMISVFASNKLTSSLRELFEATTKVAKGDFTVRVVARSNDEVGGLVESFNWMAGEVARLLENTAEKVRMEGELATVRTVQETLFPPANTRFGPLCIKGHFEPASECGGDWWSYSRIGNKIFIYIGDATGHGAPAALITSAAAVMETMADITPAVRLRF